MKIGLALAGGGIKGAAHIGVLKVLEEKKINIDMVGGTSSGSIVASLHAMGYTADEILEIFKEYCKNIKYIEIKNIFKAIYGLIFKQRLIIEGLNSGESIEKLIDKIAHKKNIFNMSDIKKDLLIPTVDLQTGKVICFTSVKKSMDISEDIMENINTISDKVIFMNEMPIGKAVRASCSYPIIFSPCKYRNTKLIDGGIRQNVPWKELKQLGADKVISVTFEDDLEYNDSKNLIQVGAASITLLCRELSNYEMIGADLNLILRGKKVNLLDMSKIDELYNLGYTEMIKNIDKIEGLVLN